MRVEFWKNINKLLSNIVYIRPEKTDLFRLSRKYEKYEQSIYHLMVFSSDFLLICIIRIGNKIKVNIDYS